MNCKDVESELLALDNQEELSPEAAAHVRECPNCSRLAEALSRAETQVLLVDKPEPELVASIMEEIGKVDLERRWKHSLAGWLFGGLLLMAALVAVRQSTTFRFLLESVLGARVDLSITVVIGLALVAYLSVFVVANSDRLEGVIQNVVSGHRH